MDYAVPQAGCQCEMCRRPYQQDRRPCLSITTRDDDGPGSEHGLPPRLRTPDPLWRSEYSSVPQQGSYLSPRHNYQEHPGATGSQPDLPSLQLPTVPSSSRKRARSEEDSSSHVPMPLLLKPSLPIEIANSLPQPAFKHQRTGSLNNMDRAPSVSVSLHEEDSEGPDVTPEANIRADDRGGLYPDENFKLDPPFKLGTEDKTARGTPRKYVVDPVIRVFHLLQLRVIKKLNRRAAQCAACDIWIKLDLRGKGIGRSSLNKHIAKCEAVQLLDLISKSDVSDVVSQLKEKLKTVREMSHRANQRTDYEQYTFSERAVDIFQARYLRQTGRCFPHLSKVRDGPSPALEDMSGAEVAEMVSTAINGLHGSEFDRLSETREDLNAENASGYVAPEGLAGNVDSQEACWGSPEQDGYQARDIELEHRSSSSVSSSSFLATPSTFPRASLPPPDIVVHDAYESNNFLTPVIPQEKSTRQFRRAGTPFDAVRDAATN